MSRTYPDRPWVGVGVIVVRGTTEVLLIQRAQPPNQGQWTLPGGGQDLGETVFETAVREVYEETGWTITGAVRLGAFRRFAYLPEYDLWAEKLCTIYLARPVRQLSLPPEPGHSAVWMDPGAAIPLLGNDGDRHFMAQVAQRLR